MLERLASANKDRVKIIKANDTESENWADKLNVESVPAFYFYLEGQNVEQFLGAPPENEIQEKIDKYVKAINL